MHSVGQHLHFSCNKFKDDSFGGYVWNGYNPSSNNTCIYLYLTHSPRELFTNEDIFLQIYPFFIEDDDIFFAPSVWINTVTKFDDEESRMTLGSSKIIDTYFIKKSLNLNPSSFFEDHFLEICDIEQDWVGLQLTLYKRKIREENPSLLKVTKFLLPPFLIHPEQFRESYGDAALVFHPLFNRFEEGSQTVNYNKYAEDMCSRILEL